MQQSNKMSSINDINLHSHSPTCHIFKSKWCLNILNNVCSFEGNACSKNQVFALQDPCGLLLKKKLSIRFFQSLNSCARQSRYIYNIDQPNIFVKNHFNAQKNNYLIVFFRHVILNSFVDLLLAYNIVHTLVVNNFNSLTSIYLILL